MSYTQDESWKLDDLRSALQTDRQKTQAGRCSRKTGRTPRWFLYNPGRAPAPALAQAVAEFATAADPGGKLHPARGKQRLGVAGKYSDTGGALLACDIHGALSAPDTEGGIVVGPDMFESVRSRSVHRSHPGAAGAMPQRLQTAATVAVTSADGYTFLFGDLQTESGTAALVSFVNPTKIRLRPGAVARACRGAAQGHAGAGAADALVAGRRQRPK